MDTQYSSLNSVNVVVINSVIVIDSAYRRYAARRT